MLTKRIFGSIVISMFLMIQIGCHNTGKERPKWIKKTTISDFHVEANGKE